MFKLSQSSCSSECNGVANSLLHGSFLFLAAGGGANVNSVGSASGSTIFLPHCHCHMKSVSLKCSEQITAPGPGFHSLPFLSCRRIFTHQRAQRSGSVGNLKKAQEIM
jgi:hypothetical protein